MLVLVGAALFLSGLSCSAAAKGGRWGQRHAREPPAPRPAIPSGRLLSEDGCSPGNPPGALDSYEEGCASYAGYEAYCGEFDDDDFSSALCEECNPTLVLCTRSLGEVLASLPSSVEHISLNDQSLVGSLPSDLAQRFPDLIELSLNGNKLEGEIPEGLWSLPRLQILHLAGNRFVGSLPEAVSQASGLVSLNLGRNRLSGPLPAAVGGWTQLQSVQLNGNSFSGGLPADCRAWTGVSVVDLSSNMLSGSLPEEVLGAWQRIRSVNFRNNKFTGGLARGMANWSGAALCHQSAMSVSGPTSFLAHSPNKWLVGPRSD